MLIQLARIIIEATLINAIAISLSTINRATFINTMVTRITIDVDILINNITVSLSTINGIAFINAIKVALTTFQMGQS